MLSSDVGYTANRPRPIADWCRWRHWCGWRLRQTRTRNVRTREWKSRRAASTPTRRDVPPPCQPSLRQQETTTLYRSEPPTHQTLGLHALPPPPPLNTVPLNIVLGQWHNLVSNGAKCECTKH